MDSCLLVIDAQASFAHRSYFRPEGMAGYLAAQNALIAGAVARGWPIVRVFHHEPGGDAGNPFALASGLVRPIEGLADFDALLTAHKTRHSALVGTGLDVWLVEHGIPRLVASEIKARTAAVLHGRFAEVLAVEQALDADHARTA